MYKLIAHRANSDSSYASNTKEAILHVLTLSYIDGVEFDIRKTKDNHLVIIHDPMINFVSDGNGLVQNMTLKELYKYQFGTKQHPSKICTLKELLSAISTDKKIVIEVKVGGIEELLYQTISPFSHLSLYICSFDYEFVKNFKKQYPQFHVGLLMGNFINHNRDFSMLDFLVVSHGSIDKIKKPIEKLAWTVNKKEDLLKLDPKYLIITDRAEYLSRISTTNRNGIF